MITTLGYMAYQEFERRNVKDNVLAYQTFRIDDADVAVFVGSACKPERDLY